MVAVVVGGWAVLEELPVLDAATQQPKVVERAPYVDKNGCNGHRLRKQSKESWSVNWDFWPAWAGVQGFG